MEQFSIIRSGHYYGAGSIEYALGNEFIYLADNEYGPVYKAWETKIPIKNIKNLNSLADSRNPNNYCTKCGEFHDADYIKHSAGVPRCRKCGGLVKPDVVLYEEGLDQAVINGAVSAIRQADCLIIGGTSLVVYPAAGLVDYFSGDKLVLINKSATSRDRSADLVISDAIGEVFSRIHC